MRNQSEQHSLALLAPAIALIAMFASPSAIASSYTLKTLYTFCVQSGCPDGWGPETGLVINPQGVIYGTAVGGGKFDIGVVYSLTPHGGTYDEKVLHSFCKTQQGDCPDGSNPLDVIEDAKGNLYGATQGGGANASGTIFSLTRTKKNWKFKTVHTFCTQAPNCADGAVPLGGLSYKGQAAGDAWDGKSPLFGSNDAGGANGNGVIFELVRKNGQWTYTVIHNLQNGMAPNPVLVDKHGNIFVTDRTGGANSGGNFYMLAANTWHEGTIHSFCALDMCLDGDFPIGRLALDSDGNVFGVTQSGGTGGTGVTFERPASGGFAVIYNFCSDGSCGKFPNGLTFGPVSHDLLGTMQEGGATNSGLAYGLQFKNGTWSQNILHDFCTDGNCTSGAKPAASIIEDASGNLFSTTGDGGNVTCQGGSGCGIVFELKP